MPEQYQKRCYRWETEAAGLVRFQAIYRESDLIIWAQRDLSGIAQAELARLHGELAVFIERHPRFRESLVPYPVTERAPAIARDMAAAAEAFGVGPMAAVAGAFAQHVGRRLLQESPEVLVENGGDLFIASVRERVVGIFAGASPYSGKLALRLQPCPQGLGLCTSSATVGPSLSLGKADTSLVLAESATMADAAATDLGNRVKRPEDIQPALAYIIERPSVWGALVTMGEHLGAAGSLELA